MRKLYWGSLDRAYKAIRQATCGPGVDAQVAMQVAMMQKRGIWKKPSGKPSK